MARLVASNYVLKPQKKRPGVHAKTKTSKQNYQKRNVKKVSGKEM